jgi:hypothetical protein
MNEIFRIPISKAQLRTIPADERNLLLLVSRAVNQQSILRKLPIFSANYQKLIGKDTRASSRRRVSRLATSSKNASVH